MPISVKRKLIKRKLVQWFFNLLPDKAKRMLFVVSLARMIKGDDNISDHTLNELNELMKLGFTDTSLRFPVYLSGVIWEDLSHDLYCNGALQYSHREFTQEDLQIILDDLSDKTRSWQIYGQEGQMVEDVTTLVMNRNLVLN